MSSEGSSTPQESISFLEANIIDAVLSSNEKAFLDGFKAAVKRYGVQEDEDTYRAAWDAWSAWEPSESTKDLVNGAAGALAQAADDLLGAATLVCDTINFAYKWVERGLYCPHTKPEAALKVIAYYPGAPWNSGVEWDVSHKGYAKDFYRDFPKAKPLPGGGKTDA